MGDYSYDDRGNITAISRKGSQATFTDALFYTYENGTNKITSIADYGSSEGFSDDGVSPGAQYDYDANGNLIEDPYKNLEISYNHLNLPDTVIQPGSNNRIVYLYDAAGNKLRKEVFNDSIILTGPFTEKEYRARFITTNGQPTSLDSTLLIAQDSIVFKPGFHAQAGMRLTAKIDSTIVPVDITDYIGGVEYRNGSIQAIYHPVGRAVPNGSNCVFAKGYDEQCWRHEFVITDHLGNTRLRFSDLDGNTQIDSTEILDEITYYPFGSPWQDAGYRYTYNGKELDRELGLRWHHYGRRMFDPVIARFTGVDPISDQFAWVSTYNYAENEPIANIDLHGLQKFYSADGNFIGSHGNSPQERVINQKQNIRLAQKVFSYGDPFQIKAFVEKDFTSEKFSSPLYRSSDLNQVYDNFAKDYKEANVENVMTMYKKEFFDEDGNPFEGFQSGNVYTDNEKRNVFLGGSKFLGSSEWEPYSAIHNHPNGTDFSGYGEGRNNYPRYGFGVTNDLGWAIEKNAKILLVTPRSNTISSFDPNVFNNILTTEGLSIYNPYELKRAVEGAITRRKIGE
jgi:RHS repeat-associated protein